MEKEMTAIELLIYLMVPEKKQKEWFKKLEEEIESIQEED